MSVPVTPSPHRIAKTRRLSLAGPPALLLLAAVAAGGAAATAPAGARGWAVTTLVVAWVVLASVVVGAVLTLRRHRRGSAKAGAEIQALHAQLARNSAESAHLVNVTLPTVVNRLREGRAPRRRSPPFLRRPTLNSSDSCGHSPTRWRSASTAPPPRSPTTRRR